MRIIKLITKICLEVPCHYPNFKNGKGEILSLMCLTYLLFLTYLTFLLDPNITDP